MSYWIMYGDCWKAKESGDAGDFIYNAMARDSDMGDTSPRAHRAYKFCKDLLAEGKRWPDDLNQENTAKNRLQWWWNDWYTRPQDDMTRDPYVAVICRAEELGRSSEIADIKIPWYCYHRGTWKWRKRLISDARPAWRKRLTHYMVKATTISTSHDPIIIANKLEI
ncbi:MAG: hypothetical protein MUO40_13995 [Anaerolineaceae bacterium]|nr:hypothetical protein [Anaerolineaceae bacterium]